MALREHLIDVDRETGELVQGWARIRQSIYVILTTRLRTRLMRLWWGSDFMETMDRPDNEKTWVEGIVAASEAINLYEPEFKIESIEITSRGPEGSPLVTVNGIDLVEEQARRAQLAL